jgi:hypothetical protein
MDGTQGERNVYYWFKGTIVSSSFTIPVLRLFIDVCRLFMDINALATTTYSGHIPLYPRPSCPLETSPASDATRLRVSAGPVPCHHFFDLAGPARQRLLASSPLVACFQRETCNTPGVCHQLSSGFELKHDRLSGEDDVKVNLWRWA